MASMVAMSKIVVSSNVRKFDGIDDLASAPLDAFPEEFQRGIKELAESIEDRGLINPLTVKDLGRGERFRLIAGFRRFKALQLLGKKQVDVKSIKGRTEDEVVIQLAENVQREDMNAMDVALALQDIGMIKNLKKQKDLAMFVGKSEAWVSYHMQLLKADESVQSAVKAGELHLNTAREITTLPKHEQKEVVEKSKATDSSGQTKVDPKAAKQTAKAKKVEKKQRQKPLPLRPVAERQAEQKQDMIDKFIAVGGTGLDKAQRLEADYEGVLSAFWDFLFDNNRLVIKAD